MSRFALILAGGVGSRTWPASRPELPKQCLPLDEGRSLLQRTAERLEGLVPLERVLVVTGREMAPEVARQLPSLGERLLVEPGRRNTAAAITWGAAEAVRRGGTRLAVLPSDHRIADPDEFRDTLGAALCSAEQAGPTLLGIRPTRPETGFGWILPGRALAIHDGRPVHEVLGFVEKPDASRASDLMARGALWNSGILCLGLSDLGLRLQRALPGAAEAYRALREGASAEAVWERIEAISIDHGLLERTPDLQVIPSSFGWSDLGSWPAMGEILPPHPLGRALVAGGLALDGGGHVVWAPGKQVATIGLEGLIIVDTPEALLVCRREDAQRVGELADLLQQSDDPTFRTARDGSA